MAYKLSGWDLSDLEEGKDMRRIERMTSKLEKTKLSNSISPKSFMALVKELEELDRITSKLACYAEIHVAEDSSNQEAAAMRAKVDTFLTKMGNRLLFIDHWFKDLPDKKAKELIDASGKYRYYFEQLRKFKRYTLKENEEKIINIKDVTGSSALNNVYDTLTSQWDYLVEGRKVTQHELLKLVRSKSAKTREATYKALLSKYKRHKDVIGEIYRNLVNDWREENVHLRGYKDPINVRNIVNDIPDKAVEALLKTCKKNEHLFHRLFELKRKKLGLDKMRRFDLYADVERRKQDIPYDEAVSMVLDTFNEFSPLFKDAALKVIKAHHVHSKVQKNKYNGAFCISPSTTVVPYVLLSYTGTSRDVSTLAHELGHAIHSVFASGQTEMTHHAALPLAETASVFAELILSDNLMKRYPDQAKDMLFTKLDEIYQTIIRQANLVLFEQKAHSMMEQGKTVQEISDVYIQDLRRQLGSKVDVHSLFAFEWCFIPHIFHTPFYCYSYAFGNLLVLALYERYRQEGPSFVPKMIDLLSKGGSESPLDITKAVGVDINSEKFWQGGFDVIKGMIDKLES